MDALPSYLRLSFEGMVFALAMPWFWAAIAILFAAAWLAHRRKASAAPSLPWLAELLIPFTFPVAMLVWAALLYASLEGKRSGWYWQDLGIWGLLLLQVAASAALLVRHRRRLYWAVGASAIAVWWAVGAMFVAGMAVYNDWL